MLQGRAWGQETLGWKGRWHFLCTALHVFPVPSRFWPSLPLGPPLLLNDRQVPCRSVGATPPGP